MLCIDIQNITARLATVPEEDFKVQSSDVPESTEIVQQETVAFGGNAEDEHVDAISPDDPVHESVDHATALLADFLSRPVRIAHYDVPQGETYVTGYRTFNPWTSFLTNSLIANKLHNYAYIQGNLHVRFVVNSSPFIYGMYCAAYRPLSSYNPQFDLPGTAAEERTPLSQRPHVCIESHKNKGGEMTLPFLLHKDWLKLTSAEVATMGKITLFPFTPFRGANSTSTNNVPITVYAWMTDVKLAGNTLSLAVQSRDEWGTGPISSISTVVAGASRKLVDVPVIGKIAKATNVVANAVTGLGNLFGFSNLPVIDDVHQFKNTVVPALASAAIGQPVSRLGLDPKGELALATEACGTESEDVLAITNIVSRETYFKSSDWDSTDALGTELLVGNVTPELRHVNSTTMYNTPTGMISDCFSQWRGDLIFTLRVVKSVYHQGRLLIAWDPLGNALTGSTPETVINTHIMDISVQEEVHIRVPYLKDMTFANCGLSPQTEIVGKGGTPPTYNPLYHNGRLTVTVLNPLTGPNSTATVSILLFVRAAENMRFANASDPVFRSSIFQVQSSDTVTLGMTPEDPVNIYDTYIGEDVRSMRTLMRRSNFLSSKSTIATRTATASQVVVYLQNRDQGMYPVYYGYDPNGTETVAKLVGTGTAPCNSDRDTVYHWLSPCFLGQRGAYRYHYINTAGGKSWVYRRNEPGSAGISAAVYPEAALNNDRNYNGQTGMELTATATQTGLSVEVPFMSNYKFMFTDPTTKWSGQTADGSDHNNITFAFSQATRINSGTTQTWWNEMDLYGSIGTDFDLIYFLNVPVRYIYTLPFPTTI